MFVQAAAFNDRPEWENTNKSFKPGSVEQRGVDSSFCNTAGQHQGFKNEPQDSSTFKGPFKVLTP